MAVFFWYLVTSDLSDVCYCARVHWTSRFFQETRNPRPSITSHSVYKIFLYKDDPLFPLETLTRSTTSGPLTKGRIHISLGNICIYCGKKIFCFRIIFIDALKIILITNLQNTPSLKKNPVYPLVQRMEYLWFYISSALICNINR